MNSSEALEPEQVDFIVRNFKVFIGILPFCVDALNNPGFIFHRVSINQDITGGSNARLKNVERIIYPPVQLGNKIDYNRCNLRGTPIFYAGAHGKLPVTIETNPQLGQLITESRWKLKTGSALRLFTVAQDIEIAMKNPDHLLDDYNKYENYLSDLPARSSMVVRAAYEFLVAAFIKVVQPYRRQGYLMSALVTDFLINHPFTPVDAIFYPSVANSGSFMNVAITTSAFDKHLEFVNATEMIVYNSPMNNKAGWNGIVTGEAKCINASSGEILWKDASRDPGPQLDYFISKYKITF